MQSFLARTQSAGLALGAALMVADCAGPTLPPASGLGQRPSLTSVDGANVALASFENSAFPYHGLIPNYQETGKTRPFLDVEDNGRLGHSSPRGRNPLGGPDLQRPQRAARRAAVLRSRRAGRDHRVLPRQYGDAVARRRRPAADRAPARRLRASTPCWSRRNSRSTRRIRAPGGSGRRAASPPSSARRIRSSANSIRTRAAPSGACRSSSSPIAAAICRPSIRSPSAAMQGRVRGVVLLDALYGERDKFVSWVEGPGRNAFFVSAYSASSKEGNDAIRARLEAEWGPDRERPPCRAQARGRGVCRRRHGRPQRLRHLRLGRRAAARHLRPHRGIGARTGRFGLSKPIPNFPGQIQPSPAKDNQGTSFNFFGRIEPFSMSYAGPLK